MTIVQFCQTSHNYRTNFLSDPGKRQINPDQGRKSLKIDTFRFYCFFYWDNRKITKIYFKNFKKRWTNSLSVKENVWHRINLHMPCSLTNSAKRNSSPIRSHETLKSLDGALQLVGWLQRFLNNIMYSPNTFILLQYKKKRK